MNKVLTLDKQNVYFQYPSLSTPACQAMGRLHKDPRTGLQKFFDGVKRLFDRVVMALPVNVRIFTGPRVSKSRPAEVASQLSKFSSRLSHARSADDLKKLSKDIHRFVIKNPDDQLKFAALSRAVHVKLDRYEYIPPSLDATHNGFF